MIKKLYIKPWKFISENLDYIKDATLLTNSAYTKDRIREAWGIDATVLYPPCPQYSFSLQDSVKKNIVCCLGRFTPEKEYEFVIEIARRRPNIRFELIGSVTPDREAYLEKLKAQASENVKFHVNASIEEKVQILARSKVLLHGFIGEHFGIALVEAMSAGAIPVTHDSGAARVDGIVNQKYRYNDIDQATKFIDDAISSWSLDEAERLRDYARKFSAETFRANLRSFLENWIRLNLNVENTIS
jgi:glycosyltransferase involved in cell wall biosynthesis